ncbi:MAG: LysM peptidoglycan-binding domain-containing protein [Bacteroidales bacterium]|nr:LysM peptidoglycan-binding domain-containing protein [Bacteroidales bacterium]
MSRTKLVAFLFFIFSSGLFAQADSIGLGSKSREFFKTQLDSMDSMWALQSLDLDSKSSQTESLAITPEKVQQTLESIEKDIPLKYSNLSWEMINFYVSEHHTQTERLLALSKKSLPQMDSIFEAHKLPNELKYLPLVKSAMNPHFMSEKGASGPWQFTYSTGRLYELDIDSYIDERRNLIQSTIAAAEMIKDLYEIYENWPLAIIAYNCGPGNLNRAIRRADKQTDIDKIYPYLPLPERDIYPAYVAMRYIIEQKKELNLASTTVQWPLTTDTVKVNKKLHLGQVSEVLNQNPRLLKDLNPQYRRNIIPASYRSFPLNLPVNIKDSFLLMKDSIYHHRDTFYFELKPEPKVTSGKKYASHKPKSPSGNHTAIYYTIKSGDNLGYISEWFDVSTSDLRYWNNIRGNVIRAGQRLMIYVPKGKADYYREYDNLSFSEKQKREGKIVEPTQKKQHSTETLEEGEYIIYEVKQGDNPWTISKKFPGVSDQDILRWNNIRPHDLKPGQKLKIKKQ